MMMQPDHGLSYSWMDTWTLPDIAQLIVPPWRQLVSAAKACSWSHDLRMAFEICQTLTIP